MEPITDWVELWRRLANRYTWGAPRPARGDAWKDRARGYCDKVRRRWARHPDSSRTWLAGQLDRETSLLDIGAGTGAWTLFAATRARRVTAVDPSAAMLQVLREQLVEGDLDVVVDLEHGS